MFEDCSGRVIACIEDAKCYIWKFIAENQSADRQILQRSHDFDLYLPWLLEIVEYQKTPAGEPTRPILEVQRLYMDAAWGLVMEGFLRPGPRTITGDCHKEGYGKGYSLTLLGLQRLNEQVAGHRAGLI